MRNFKNYGKKYQGGFLGIGALVLGAVGLYEQYQASSDAADLAQQQAAQQNIAAEAQQRAANVSTQRERIKQIREARINRARIISQASNTGIGIASTGVSGALGSVTSQENANLGGINVAQGFASEAAAAHQRAATLGGQIAQDQAVAAQWQTISGLAMNVFSKQGGWSSIFSKEVAQANSTPARSVSTNEFVNQK